MAAWMGRAAVSALSGSTGQFGLLGWVTMLSPAPLSHRLEPRPCHTAGLAVARPLSLRAEESESQCWGEHRALIIKSPSKKS